MNDLDFKEEVAPEISDRWSGRITPAMLSDWHYHVRTFTVKESIEHIRKYFSQYDGRGNPRPADFGSWLKKNQVRTEQRSKVQRFDIKASWWPKVTAFKAVFANDNKIRFGWIERKDYAERGYIWIRRGSHWYLECFKPNEIKGAALPNPASITLHERLGFRKVGHLPEIGRKLGRWVDVGYWALLLGEGGTRRLPTRSGETE